jgi:hypothetical protein
MSTDAFEMALVHRAFSSELHNSVDLIRNTFSRDVTRSAIVGGHVDFMLTGLRHHHAAEDEVIGPKLQARSSAHVGEITRMEGAHSELSGQIAQVSKVARSWADSADLVHAKRLIIALERLCALLDEHLADEEHAMVPLINAQLTPREWRQFLARGGRFLFAHPKLGLVLAGFVLDPVSAGERKRFLANVPLPQRVAFQLFGTRTYATYRAKLYPAA